MPVEGHSDFYVGLHGDVQKKSPGEGSEGEAHATEVAEYYSNHQALMTIITNSSRGLVPSCHASDAIFFLCEAKHKNAA